MTLVIIKPRNMTPTANQIRAYMHTLTDAVESGDDAILAEKAADHFNLDLEEHEDLIFDCAMEVCGGCF